MEFNDQGVKFLNIKIIIEYDGSHYSGWQKQQNLSTIQGKIEEAIKKITGEEIEIFASGRTDAGVHALGQVANFEIESKIPAEKFKFAINQHLPEDIRVLSSEKTIAGFHARFSAKRKTYLYRIQTGEVRRPFERNLSYFVKGDLDIEKMIDCAKYLIGEHDFSSFKSEGSSARHFVREIYSLDVRRKEDIIEIEISGNGFLYNMVRIIAGTLIEAGKGREQNIPKILMAKDRTLAGPTAPAHGLFLKEVLY